jgi:sacsin
MLMHVAKLHPEKSPFSKWPLTAPDSSTIGSNICRKVLEIIKNGCYSLWFTDLGYVASESALLATRMESSTLRTGLKELGIPVIFAPAKMLSIMQNVAKTLNPSSLCDSLATKKDKLRAASENSKQVLLEYVISDPSFRGYGAVELFPFENGTYKSLNEGVAFVHRSQMEHDVFRLEGQRNIDVDKLSAKSLQVLHGGFLSPSSLHHSLRQRGSQDLKSYLLNTCFKDFNQDQDVVRLKDDSKSYISKVWNWIVGRKLNLLDESISCLWLVPLSDGQYRKIKPRISSWQTIHAPEGKIGDVLRYLASIESVDNKPILLSGSLSSSALQLLTSLSKIETCMAIKSGESLDDFVLWLTRFPKILDLTIDKDGPLVQELLISNTHLCSNRSAVSKAIRKLKIFQSLYWSSDCDAETPCTEYVRIDGYARAVGVQGPIPGVPRVLFLDSRSQVTSRLLREFKLAEFPTSVNVLKDFVVPFCEKGSLKDCSVPCKKSVAQLLFSNFPKLEAKDRERVASVGFIPVARRDGMSSSSLLTASQLIDPLSAVLTGLHFEDEEVYPEAWVINRFRGTLIDMGMSIILHENLVKDRVHTFANRAISTEPTWERARKLLESEPCWTSDPDDEQLLSLRELKWLPATDHHSTKRLASASECRGLEDKLLVGFVLPLLDFEISAEWRQRLGLTETIDHAILLNQLEKGIDQHDRKVVDAVLKYVREQGQETLFYDPLKELRCILTNDGFTVPGKTFRVGCDRLQPYLNNIDSGYWYDHCVLLGGLGIEEKPTLEDLLLVQKELQEKEPLNEADIAVAIELIRLASTFHKGKLSPLMVLSEKGRHLEIHDVAFNDLGPLSTVTGAFNSAHPEIPQHILRMLNVEPLSEKIEKGELGLADDEDEFDQKEDVTTSIRGTLDRYPVTSTFKEYLANADDAGSASKIHWLLDGRKHPREALITKELSEFQGSALLVQNNGVFQDKDFEGFKHVGMGSKRNDSTSIGKFGRGSQTMYHWTDVPMLLSGKYLLILDPLKQVLPMNYRKGHRKAGVKIELSKLKKLYPNQLAPFKDLWGYKQDLDYYSGTIFRFPLRPKHAQSKLRESNISPDSDTARWHLDNFFQEARICLPFLRNVLEIDFKIYGHEHPRWSIKSSRVGMAGDFSDWTLCTVTKNGGSNLAATAEDRWWVAMQDPPGCPVELQGSHKRTGKDVECGIAAFIFSKSTDKTIIPETAPEPRIFSTLPLHFSSDLPIHLHATFLLTGDRQSIVVEKSAQDAGADWNRWLLTTALPSLYLEFLEDLGRKTGHQIFRFWPQKPPPKDSLGSLIYSSFWQALLLSSCRLFPAGLESSEVKKRQPPKFLALKEATFDLLPAKDSVILKEMLVLLIPNLARVPTPIAEKLRSTPEQLTTLTSEMLRKCLKSDKVIEYIQKAHSRTGFMESLFRVILPKTDAEIDELDGCNVIVLGDGSIGTLRLIDSSETIKTYYTVNEHEKELFEFASSVLTDFEKGKEFKSKVLDFSKRFNLERLNLSHVGRLLEKKDFGDCRPSVEMDAWLSKFWHYWRFCESQVKEGLPKDYMVASRMDHCVVFEATCSGVRSYLKPWDFEGLPSVVEPSDEQDRALCDKIPDLHRFNPKHLPTYLQKAEDSFKQPASLIRLLRSLELLSVDAWKDLENYVADILGTDELKVCLSNSCVSFQSI